ncbi:MAG: sigma-70 family RNA polymerase sigma factor [Candidatus Omnitrophota bacterium]
MKNQIYVDFKSMKLYTISVMDIQTLLTECINRNQNAWASFVNIHNRLIAKSVNHKLNQLGLKFTKSERQDIVQEIFFRIWEKNRLKDIQNISCLENWLIIISLNITSNYCKEKTYRNARNTVSLDNAIHFNRKQNTLIKTLAADLFNTESSLNARELRVIMSQAISKLEHRQQLVLKFYFYNNKKYKEIAEIMRIPKGTVATLINRAQKNMKKILRKYI